MGQGGLSQGAGRLTVQAGMIIKSPECHLQLTQSRLKSSHIPAWNKHKTQRISSVMASLLASGGPRHFLASESMTPISASSFMVLPFSPCVVKSSSFCACLSLYPQVFILFFNKDAHRIGLGPTLSISF